MKKDVFPQSSLQCVVAARSIGAAIVSLQLRKVPRRAPR